MSLAQLNSRAQLGIDAPPVRVEVHIANGLPAFTVVGLPETAVREARDRVRSAIINSGFDFPARRITVNLAPADLPVVFHTVLQITGDIWSESLTGERIGAVT